MNRAVPSNSAPRAAWLDWPDLHFGPVNLRSLHPAWKQKLLAGPLTRGERPQP